MIPLLTPDTTTENSETTSAPPENGNGKISQMSANTIAAKIGGKTVTELAIVACAHLVIIQGKDTFKRIDILTEMKTATNYYKSSYGGNLNRTLAKLVTDSKLIERSKGVYAIPANELTRIKTLLSGNWSKKRIIKK